MKALQNTIPRLSITKFTGAVLKSSSQWQLKEF